MVGAWDGNSAGAETRLIPPVLLVLNERGVQLAVKETKPKEGYNYLQRAHGGVGNGAVGGVGCGQD